MNYVVIIDILGTWGGYMTHALQSILGREHGAAQTPTKNKTI